MKSILFLFLFQYSRENQNYLCQEEDVLLLGSLCFLLFHLLCFIQELKTQCISESVLSLFLDIIIGGLLYPSCIDKFSHCTPWGIQWQNSVFVEVSSSPLVMHQSVASTISYPYWMHRALDIVSLLHVPYWYSLIEHYRTHYIHCSGEWEKEIKCVHAFSLDLFGSAWFSWLGLLSVKMCCAHLCLDHWYILLLLIEWIGHRVYSCTCS